MKFSKDYRIRYYNCDLRMKASMVSILRLFEDIALQQSESLGVGLEFYNENKIAWMLSKWEIEINRLPMFDDIVTIITEPKAFKDFYANRSYTVKDVSGANLITAKTLWLYIDLNTKRPKRVDEVMYQKYGLTIESEKIFSKLDQIEKINSYSSAKSFKVRRRDIDTNLHANNSSYVEWALETLPLEFLSSNSISKMQVQYKKELKLDDELISHANLEENAEGSIGYHQITSNGKECCLIKTDWEKD